jgi:hypothetical protein
MILKNKHPFSKLPFPLVLFLLLLILAFCFIQISSAFYSLYQSH